MRLFDIFKKKSVEQLNKDNKTVQLNVIPMKSVNELQFGMTREQIHSLWGETKTFQKSQFDKKLTDNYTFCHIFYDENDLFEAIEIFDKNKDRNINIYYDGVKLSKKYSEVLNFFKNKYDDIEEDSDGFITVKGSVGVGRDYENDEDKVDAILFGKKDYYK